MTVETEMTWENELAIASHGKAESAGTFVGEQLSRHQEAASMPLEAMKNETTSNLLTTREKHDKPLISQPQAVAVERVVVVEKGDTLQMIIKETYEKYDKKILSRVLQENPAIQSPDMIFVGQVIRLPNVTDKP
jgi:nucleoid-associated protein YgaU